MTNFLTEDDLNRWFVKILWALGIAVGPVIVGQIFSIWNESRHSAKNDVKELKNQQQNFLNTLSRIEDQLQILRERPYVSAADVHKIAREESEKSIEFMERIKHRQ